MNPHKTHTPLGTLNLRSLESGLAEMLLLIPKWNEEKAKPVVSSGYAEDFEWTSVKLRLKLQESSFSHQRVSFLIAAGAACHALLFPQTCLSVWDGHKTWHIRNNGNDAKAGRAGAWQRGDSQREWTFSGQPSSPRPERGHCGGLKL